MIGQQLCLLAGITGNYFFEHWQVLLSIGASNMCVKNLDSKYLELLTFLLNGSTASRSRPRAAGISWLAMVVFLAFSLGTPRASLHQYSEVYPRNTCMREHTTCGAR